MQAGKSAAAICTRIDDPTVQTILYWLIVSLITVMLIAVACLILYFPIRKYMSWYKKYICDRISLWVAVITLAITVFLADEAKSILQVNLISFNLIIHLTYTCIRAYAMSSKRNSEYC